MPVEQEALAREKDILRMSLDRISQSRDISISRPRKVVVMIPALNEERGIGKVIDGVPWERLADAGFATEVMVVDGRSTDRTLEIAASKGAKLFVQKGKGKGTGMREAFSLSHPTQLAMNASSMRGGVDIEMRTMSSYLDADHVVMLDGDGTYPSEYIFDVVLTLEAGSDVVMGSRFHGKIADGAMTKLNKVGNLVLSTAASVIYLHPISDLCTGLWGFRTSALRKLTLDSKAFELEAEMFAEAVKNHLLIKEVPINYMPRDGETKLVPIKSGMMIMRKLVERRLLNARGGFDFFRLDDAISTPTSH